MSDVNRDRKSPQPFVAPHPGSHTMPRWDTAELPDAPRITLRSWALLVGPGLVAAGAAIGGGEWLAGPLTTARYGGAILWLATISILVQVFYNLEICRYTLYCGEPIFTGKFRLLPGPLFWLVTYLFLDFGSIFPYLVASAATPLAAVVVGEIPDADKVYVLFGIAMYGKTLLRWFTYVVFLMSLAPLVFGGKVYNSLKAIMSFKIVVVFGFLVLVAFFYSSLDTWIDILSGFFKFGSIPVHGADANALPGVENIFVNLWNGTPLPKVDLTMVPLLGALAAIAGNGGLTNTALSGYARDQGWGMGKHVGAIPSVIGGQQLTLSHEGCVFPINTESVSRFRRWYKFLLRDQLVVWLPACFIGVALPSMLSVQFLPRGTQAKDWVAAGMTADALKKAVGSHLGTYFWFMTLFCGFLVLAPAAVTTFDGALRRWVDLCWTAVPFVRRWESHRIRWLYFGAVCGYTVFGLIALTLWNPKELLQWATNIYNAALGFSCFQVIAVNTILLPRELRPNWFMRIGLVVGGVFFTTLFVITTLHLLGKIWRVMNDMQFIAADIAQYARDGYLLVPQLFATNEITLLRDTAKRDRALDQQAYGRDDGEGGSVRLSLWNHPGDDLYGMFSRNERIVARVEQLLGDEPYHYHSKMIMKEARTGGAWAWHQDYGYWYDNGVLFPNLCSVFVAVDPASRENGCLQVLRGSHAMGRITHMKTGDQTGADPERVAAAAERLELVHVEMEPGDALFFHANLLHRSDQNRSAHDRWALVCCYNCRSNDPYREGKHPGYTPLDRVASNAIRDLANQESYSTNGQEF